jgi:hypothetical protein
MAARARERSVEATEWLETDCRCDRRRRPRAPDGE